MDSTPNDNPLHHSPPERAPRPPLQTLDPFTPLPTPGKKQQGEHHGCPYKTWGAARLSAALQAMGLPSDKTNEALTKARGGHYQLACAAVWEGSHGCECTTGITHPNQARVCLCACICTCMCLCANQSRAKLQTRTISPCGAPAPLSDEQPYNIKNYPLHTHTCAQYYDESRKALAAKAAEQGGQQGGQQAQQQAGADSTPTAAGATSMEP